MNDRDDDRSRDDRDDYDDRPRRRPAGDGGSNGYATAALVFGILSFCTSAFGGLPAIILGIVGISRAGQTGSGKGRAIAGLILGVTGTLATFVLAVMIGLLLPAVQKVREAAARATSTNNLKQIAIGVHSFNDVQTRMPFAGGDPAISGVKGGEVDPSLSWRVAMLPYIEQGALFQSFKADQPWDSAANRPASDTVVKSYVRPGDVPDATTPYRGFVGPGTVFEPAAGEKPLKLFEIEDGTSNTILAVEAADTVPWAQTKEISFDPKGPLPTIARPGQKVFLAVMCDGSVRSVSTSVSPATLKNAITRNDGAVLGADW